MPCQPMTGRAQVAVIRGERRTDNYKEEGRRTGCHRRGSMLSWRELWCQTALGLMLENLGLLHSLL